MVLWTDEYYKLYVFSGRIIVVSLFFLRKQELYPYRFGGVHFGPNVKPIPGVIQNLAAK
jgi:hypothetical protein